VVVRQSNTTRPNRLRWLFLFLLGGALSLCIIGAGVLLASPMLTYKGVPLKILWKFITDEPAREAYFAHNRLALHNRLQNLGVEEEIKAFYRPKIHDEDKLDRYIHQLMYDNTGYVGKAYIVDGQGILVPHSEAPAEFKQWFALAQRLQLAKSYKMENDQVMVITPQGDAIAYETIAELYPISDLEKWISLQR
jgi:hypothetical protein